MPVLMYNVIESRLRLERRGFHPAVTSKSPCQVVEEWHEMIKDAASLPTFDKYCGEGRDSLPEEKNSDRARLASTSLLVLQHVMDESTIFDSVAGAFTHGGPSRLFIDVAPMYTVEDIFGKRTTSSGETCCPRIGPLEPKDWKGMAINAEYDVMRRLIHCKRIFGRTSSPFWRRQGEKDNHPQLDSISGISKKTFLHIRALKKAHSGYMLDENALMELTGHLPYEPSLEWSSLKLRQMLEIIHEGRLEMKRLEFHGTRLLDRRILAIILRACPQVTSLGVFDCPLMHFGDIICLLDLIHEINIERTSHGRLGIMSLDFGPYFEAGTPFQHPQAATYGLVWSVNEDHEPLQRGFFQIILEAVLKSRNLGIEHLFEEGKAFMSFLRKVPNTPLAVYGFLDAIHRYLELDIRDPDYSINQFPVLFDLFKPVCCGLEGPLRPSSAGRKQSRKMFCCSCGYSVCAVFFSKSERERPKFHRRCSKCIIRYWMDNQENLLKRSKRDFLTQLFPTWNGQEYNPDAPLGDKGDDLIELTTTLEADDTSVSGSTPESQVYEAPPLHKSPLRYDKYHDDSLQNLPTLSHLVSRHPGPDCWETPETKNFILNADLERGAMHLLRKEYDAASATPAVPAFETTRTDGALPGNPKMAQPVTYRGEMRYDYERAKRLHKEEMCMLEESRGTSAPEEEVDLYSAD